MKLIKAYMYPRGKSILSWGGGNCPLCPLPPKNLLCVWHQMHPQDNHVYAYEL